MVNVLMAGCIIVLLLGVIAHIYPQKLHLDVRFLSKNHTDIIKGVGIFIIVISHIGNFSGARYFTFLGGIGVALFLICSGFGLYKSYEKTGLDDFFKKRLFKVIIPYWVLVIAYYIINPSEFTMLALISNILLVSTVNAYTWFVQFIILLYIMFYLVYRFVPENKRIPFIGLLSIMFFLLVKNGLWAEQAFSFLIGISFAKYSKDKIPVSKARLIGCSTLILGIVSLFIKQLPVIRNSNYLVFNGVQVVLKIAIAIGIIYLTYLLLRFSLSKIFAFAGTVSYEIYLVHTLFIFIVINGFTKINLIMYIMVCCLAVYVFYIVNKILLKQRRVVKKM